MLNTASVARLLAQPLAADPALLSYVLVTRNGTVLINQTSSSVDEESDGFPIDMTLHDKIYGMLAARAWCLRDPPPAPSNADPVRWIGLSLASAKLAIFPAGKLLLLVVAQPSAAWGFIELMGSRTSKTLTDGLGDFNVPE